MTTPITLHGAISSGFEINNDGSFTGTISLRKNAVMVLFDASSGEYRRASSNRKRIHPEDMEELNKIVIQEGFPNDNA